MKAKVRHPLIGALLLALFQGCGGGGGSPASTYRLEPAPSDFTHGSVISFRAPIISGFPPIQESLDGTLQIVQNPEPLPPMTTASFTITALHFRSASYRVDGTSGTIRVTASDGGRVLSSATVSINGQQVELTGESLLETFSGDPPIFRGLGLAAPTGHAISIVAAPEN